MDEIALYTVCKTFWELSSMCPWSLKTQIQSRIRLLTTLYEPTRRILFLFSWTIVPYSNWLNHNFALNLDISDSIYWKNWKNPDSHFWIFSSCRRIIQFWTSLTDHEQLYFAALYEDSTIIQRYIEYILGI